jgi:Uma2 family endonuclease
MGSAARSLSPATLDDLLAKPEDECWEIINGELVQQTMTRFWHSRGQARIATRIGDPYDQHPGGNGPGGWWILTDITVELAPDQIYRPDIAGYLRERLPDPPTDFPVRLRPDWTCEIISPSNSENDLTTKKQVYHQYHVPHYWILDPEERTLQVMRWSLSGYVTVQTAKRGERLRAEPFEEVEISMDDIFGVVPPKILGRSEK